MELGLLKRIIANLVLWTRGSVDKSLRNQVMEARNALPLDIWQEVTLFSDGPMIPISELGKCDLVDYLTRILCPRWYTFEESDGFLSKYFQGDESSRKYYTEIYMNIENARNKYLKEGDIFMSFNPQSLETLVPEMCEELERPLRFPSTAFASQPRKSLVITSNSESKNYSQLHMREFCTSPVVGAITCVTQIDISGSLTKGMLDQFLVFIGECKELDTLKITDTWMTFLEPDSHIYLNQILLAISVRRMKVIEAKRTHMFCIVEEDSPLLYDTTQLREIDYLGISLELDDKNWCDPFMFPIIQRVGDLCIRDDRHSWPQSVENHPIVVHSMDTRFLNICAANKFPGVWEAIEWNNLEFLLCKSNDAEIICKQSPYLKVLCMDMYEEGSEEEISFENIKETVIFWMSFPDMQKIRRISAAVREKIGDSMPISKVVIGKKDGTVQEIDPANYNGDDRQLRVVLFVFTVEPETRSFTLSRIRHFIHRREKYSWDRTIISCIDYLCEQFEEWSVSILE